MLPAQKHTTAILVFANSPEEELHHKAIAKGQGLFDTLTKHTLETVKNTGLPYFLFTEKHQIGASFGARFTNAIKAVFDQGYNTIITLGNDTPRLKTSHILKAKKQLEAKKIVFGPAKDGGFYLMGLHRSQFSNNALRKLPWQTSGLLKAVKALFSNTGIEVFQLQMLSDIDTLSDLKGFAKTTFGLHRALIQLLSYLFQLKKDIPRHEKAYQTSFYSSTSYNKGSPTLTFS